MKNKITTLAASACAAFALAMGSQASALILTVNGGSATIECTPTCTGFTGGGAPSVPTGLATFSSSAADIYDVSPSSEASEASAIALLTGTSPVSAVSVSLTRVETNDVPTANFSTTADVVAFKLGLGHFFVKNETGGLINYIFTQADGRTGAGAGLSHYTGFDLGDTPTDPVPLPAAALLFLGGAGFFGGLRHRAKKTA